MIDDSRDAIALLARDNLAQLTSEDRASLLLDWWTIDDEDREFAQLPEMTRAALCRDDEPGEAMSPLYEPLLLLGLRRRFVGVLNEYLERRVAALGHGGRVEGSVERLEECPCCGYQTLSERGGYDICRVCFLGG